MNLDFLGKLDWKDIAQHAAGGLAAGFLAYLFWWPLLIANAAFWIGREAYQRIEQDQPMTHMFAPQPLFEWAVPSLIAPIIYFIIPLGM